MTPNVTCLDPRRVHKASTIQMKLSSLEKKPEFTFDAKQLKVFQFQMQNVQMMNQLIYDKI